MKTNLKRVLSLVCALALCIGMLPASALAVEGDGTPGSEQSVTATKNGITVSKKLTGNAEDGYRIEMEAYASNTVITSAGEATPLDIVLVLDTSGSMKEGLGDDEGWKYTPTETKEWTYNDIAKTYTQYYYFDGHDYRQVRANVDRERDYFDFDSWEWVYSYSNYRLEYGSNRNPTQLGSSGESEDSVLWTDVLYTAEYVSADTKLEAMQAAVGTFIDTVAEEAQSQNADHRIGIISFAARANTVEDLTSVSSGADDLKNAVDHLQANGGTQSDDGLDAAKDMLNGVRRDSKKVVILFTDGEPGDYGFTGSVAAAAVNTAKELKDDGVTVYTIGVFEGADPSDTEWNFNRYMNAVSSNYPEATAEYTHSRPHGGQITVNSWEDLELGDRAEGDYYFAADDAASLSDVFEGIAEDVTTSTLEAYPDEKAVLSDTLTEYVSFPADMQTSGEESDVSISYVPVSSINNDTIAWGSPDDVPNDIEVDVKDGTIKITGFDYVKHAVTATTDKDGTTTYSGGKLVVSFPIEVDAEATAQGGTFPTNNTVESKAGLEYKSKKDALHNNASTELTESPEITVEATYPEEHTGTAITVKVVLDGDTDRPITGSGIDGYIDVRPTQNATESGNPDWNPGTYGNGQVTYSFTYYDCKDITFTAESGFVIEAVDADLVYGQSKCSGITEENGDVTADNVQGGSTVTVYVRTLYTAQFHGTDGNVIDNYTVDGLVADRKEGLEAVSPNVSRPELGHSYDGNDYQNVCSREDNHYKDEDHDGVCDTHAPATEDGKQEAYDFVYVADNLKTTVTMPSLPEGSEGQTVSGWWLNDSTCEGNVDYAVGAEYTVVGADADNDKIIHFYSKATDNIYTITVKVTNGTAAAEGLSEGTDDGDTTIYTIQVTHGGNATINFTPADDYALDTVTVDSAPYAVPEADRGNFGSYKFENVTADHEIVVVYSEDENGDNVPDKYQVTVKYEATTGGNITGIQQEVLTIYADDGMTYAETGDVTASGSTATPDETHFFREWTISKEGAIPPTTQQFEKYMLTNVKGGETYTFKAYFTEKTYGIDVEKTLESVGDTIISEGVEIPMVQAGDEIVWEIKVTNTGNQPLTEIRVEDELTSTTGQTPAGTLTFKDFNNAGNVNFELDRVVTIDNLDPNASETFTVVYTVAEADEGLTLNNAAAVTAGDEKDEDDPNTPVTVEKKDLEITKTADRTTANRGDTITYTITVTNTGNVDLTGVTVSDEMMDGRITVQTDDWITPDETAEGSYEIGTLAVGQTVTIIYTHEVTAADVAAEEIKNVATVSSPDLPDDKEPEDEVTIPTHDYTVTITPADMTVYTGGEVYGNIVDEDGNVIEETSGLPEPGYYFVLSDDVTKWLGENGFSGDTATRLDEVLDFYYYDIETDKAIRHWKLDYMGIHDRNATGDAIRYVYRLTPDEITQTEVRLAFTDDNHIVSSDNIIMGPDTVYANYEMTIYGGGLEQSDIVAELTVGEEENAETITCNVEIGTGNLIVRSVVNQANNTNEIAASETAVDNNVITAVDNDSVTYYVNNSEVEIPVEANADRVQLLVDKVSNSDTFNAAMGEDAIEHLNKNLSNAAYDLAYLDLVDTENGNAVVTMGDNDKLTIYWPVPDDAASNSDFHIVHYTGMDRHDEDSIVGMDELANAPKETPDVRTDTIDGQKYVIFEADSFSPFVLVYEEEDEPYVPPVDDDDDDRPAHRPHRPDRDDEPEELNTEDHVAYLIGFTDGTIRPEANITRAEVATIFFRLLTDEARETYWSQYSPYSDVKADAWYNNAVCTLSRMGILNGYPDGTFRPDAPITRSEFTKVAISFFDYAEGYYVYGGEFSDVTGAEWFASYLAAALDYGLIEGMPDGTFRPLNNISRAEACTIVNRTLGREPDGDHLLSRREMITWPDNSTSAWYYADMQEATNSHDYYWDEDDEVEEWTEKLEERDWAALERSWSNAYDAPGGEVMD